MGIINLDEIKQDMVLAEDLKGNNGRFLLAKGTVLTQKHLKVFKIWGVIEANIEGISKENVEKDREIQIDPATIEKANNEVRKRFIHNDLEQPVVNELFRLCTIREAEKLISNKQEENLAPRGPIGTETERAETIENITTHINPAELIKKDTNLSTLPTIFMEIEEAIKKPNSSANYMANVISKDTSLSARLLKIVNSAFYSLPIKVDTLSRAVSIVGTKQLSALALGINVITAFNNIPRDLVDMKSFWKHSVACGIISRIIANYKGIQNTERLFVAGLLHDIGRLIMYNSVPGNVKNMLLKARNSNRLLHVVEHETMGFDHTTVGEMLLRKWKLPMSLEKSVKYHHSPKNSKDPLEPSIIHLANIMTIALGIGSSGEHSVPSLESEAWECIELSPNILPLILTQLDSQIEEILTFLNSNES